MADATSRCPGCNAEVSPGADACLNCGRHLGAFLAGALIASRYEVLSLLGKGGMGMVYKAQDTLLDETVAIKVLRNEYVQDPAMAQRFRSEIKLARKVSHPNVCRIHEYGEDGAVSYISMALIEGTDLRKILQKHPHGLPTDLAFRLSLQITEGLQAIHDVGIIHRDLKSPNIVCDSSGAARLMDFGIAKESGRVGGLTAVGEVMGTPEYMSPEQCRGNTLDFRSDIYSLGVVIYEMFTGKVPFKGDSVMSTLLKQVEDPPPLTGPVADRIPPGVVEVLRKALAKSPGDRYKSATEVAAALLEAQDQFEERAQVMEAAGPTRVLEPVAERETASDKESETASDKERRRDTRLPISLDLMLRRLSAGGSVLEEERTVTDNIGAHGARVLTTMKGVTEGHTVSIQEVGGSFATRSVVRHVSTGNDKVRRLGVEFLDRGAPDHLVPKDDSKPRISLTPPSGPTGIDRRKHSRISISIDVILRRLSPGGAVLREERTIVDNIGRRGARVLTTMDLSVGDTISIQEVGAEFQTRAAVRSVITGTDNIRRLGLEFLDRSAPDHLVPAADEMTRSSKPMKRVAQPEPAPLPSPPPPAVEAPSSEETSRRRTEIQSTFAGLKTQTHFEVLGLPRASGPAQVKEAYFRLSRQYHPDAGLPSGLVDLAAEVQAIFIRVGEAYKVLIDPESRSRYESLLGPSRSRPPSVQAPTPPSTAAAPQTPPPQTQAPLPPVPPPASPTVPTPDKGALPVASAEADLDTPTRLAEQILQEAKALLATDKYWDAIQKLEKATQLAKGSKVNQAIRILLAQTNARNPKWLKQAENALLAIVAEDPKSVDAYLALGGVYKAAGLMSRAAAQLRKALELDPQNPRVRAELDALLSSH